MMSWVFDGRKRRREGSDGLEAAAELRQIDSEEMKNHATPDSCWVSIDGLVYDVTNFHHPGGNDRLFDRGGKDVTKAFGAIRHSDAARKHLRRLLIGQINTSQAPPPPEASLLRTPSSLLLATAAEGGATESRAPLRFLKAGATHRLPRPGEAVWSTRCRGFLPAYDPVSTLGPPYEVLIELVAALPASLASGDFRALVDQQAARLAAVEAAIAAEQELGVLDPDPNPHPNPNPHRPLRLHRQGLRARRRRGGRGAARAQLPQPRMAGGLAPPRAASHDRLRRLRDLQLGADRQARAHDARERAHP